MNGSTEPEPWNLSHIDWPIALTRLERWIELLDINRDGDERWAAAKAGTATLWHPEDAELTEALVRATQRLALRPDRARVDGQARWYEHAHYLLAATLVNALLAQGRVDDARRALDVANDGNDGSASTALGQLLSLTSGRLAAAEGETKRAYTEFWNAVDWGNHPGSDPKLVLEGLSELMSMDPSDLRGVPASSEWVRLVHLLAARVMPGPELDL